MSQLPDPPQSRERGAPHILLVDDDQTLAVAIARMLQAAGFHVDVASDFRRALELLDGTEPIDLLLTDIVMPDSVNGIALGRMARMRQRGIKLIYMTAYDIPGVEESADGPVLLKPVSDERLIGEIRRALSLG